MKAIRSSVRLHRNVDISSSWEDVKEWARRNTTKEKIAQAGLSLAAAVSICYLGSEIYVGLQNFVMYAY